MQINIRRKIKNWMQLEFQAISENEQLARIAVASFITPLNPTLEEMADIKTAVSEAVTNAIIHGYEEEEGEVYLRCRLDGDLLEVEIEDKGKGIENIDKGLPFPPPGDRPIPGIKPTSRVSPAVAGRFFTTSST